MSYREVFTCDVCGEEKRETNHWLLFNKRQTSSFSLFSCTSEIRTALGLGHLCGAKCAHTLLDNWLSARQQERKW